MAWADDIGKLGKNWVWYVEIEPRTCDEVYGVAPCTASGGQCAYSWATCEDPANFDLTTRIFKFASKKGGLTFPGEQVQPTLIAVSDLPTEIDPKKFTTINARIQLTFEDVVNPPPIDVDKGAGKFYAYGTSTFWRIFQRIYRESYKYCAIRIYEGLPEYTTLGDYKLRRELKLNNIEVLSDGKVKVTGTDKTRATKQIKIPNQISSTNLTDASMGPGATAPVPVTDTTEFKEMPFASGPFYEQNYVKIIDESSGGEDEYIRFDWIDHVNGLLEGTERGLFGTNITSHPAGCKVIQVAAFANNADTGLLADLGMNPIDAILFILRGWVGIAAADIDLTQFEDEKEVWYNSRAIRRIVESPIQADKLIAQLCQLMMGNVWQNEEQKLTFKGFHPNAITETVADLTTTDDIINNTLKNDAKVETQVSRVFLYYSPSDTWGVKDYKDPDEFDDKILWIDAAAENSNGQGDIVEIEFFANWFWKLEDARRFVSRYIKRYAPTAPAEANFTLYRKDAEIETGDLVDITSPLFVNDDGSDRTVNWQVLAKTESQQGIIKLKALETKFTLRYAIIAPDLSGGNPDYTSATDAQKEYGFICEVLSDGTAQMTNGDPAYYIW